MPTVFPKSDLLSEVKLWKKPVHLTREKIAKSYLKLLPSTKIIGITGSVGKTTAQNAVYKVLSQKYRVVSGEENLDPTFRIPKTILSAKPWDQFIILEYGVERVGEMDYYLDIAKPQIVTVTKITPTHLKYFKSIDGVKEEKSKLIEALPNSGQVILNADDPNSHDLKSKTKAKVIWFGQKAKGGLKISHFRENIYGSSFRFHYGGQKATVSWKLVGKHNLQAAYIAGTIGILQKLTLKQIAKGLSQLKASEHRLNPQVTKKSYILDDSYNSSPSALKESLHTLLSVGKGYKKIAVLGDMKDLGQSSEVEHKKIGESIAKSSINILVTVGKEAALIAKNAKKLKFKGKIFSTNSTKEALRIVKETKFKKPLILIKGSRHAHLERIVFGLMHKSTKISCYHCGRLN